MCQNVKDLHSTIGSIDPLDMYGQAYQKHLCELTVEEAFATKTLQTIEIMQTHSYHNIVKLKWLT
jgi:hypothetical protein